MPGIKEEIDDFFKDGVREVMDKMARAGEAAVKHNVEHGNYRNRTWRLRRSNFYEVNESGLTIGNSADYADDVEAKGYMVCSEGALIAEQMLNNGN